MTTRTNNKVSLKKGLTSLGGRYCRPDSQDFLFLKNMIHVIVDKCRYSKFKFNNHSWLFLFRLNLNKVNTYEYRADSTASMEPDSVYMRIKRILKSKVVDKLGFSLIYPLNLLSVIV
jgi:hypothetical protein